MASEAAWLCRHLDLGLQNPEMVHSITSAPGHSIWYCATYLQQPWAQDLRLLLLKSSSHMHTLTHVHTHTAQPLGPSHAMSPCGVLLNSHSQSMAPWAPGLNSLWNATLTLTLTLTSREAALAPTPSVIQTEATFHVAPRTGEWLPFPHCPVIARPLGTMVPGIHCSAQRGTGSRCHCARQCHGAV